MTTIVKRVEKPSNSGTGKMFDNPFLERLTRTHIAVPIGLFVTIASVLIFWGNTREMMSLVSLFALFLIGWLAFTLVEYVVHKFVFHMSTDTKAREDLQYKFHGIHHDYPKDKDRLAMPPVMSLTISTLLFFVFKLAMGTAVFGFLPGFIFGYAMYLFVHYIVHAYQPPNDQSMFLTRALTAADSSVSPTARNCNASCLYSGNVEASSANPLNAHALTILFRSEKQVLINISTSAFRNGSIGIKGID